MKPVITSLGTDSLNLAMHLRWPSNNSAIFFLLDLDLTSSSSLAASPSGYILGWILSVKNDITCCTSSNPWNHQWNHHMFPLHHPTSTCGPKLQNSSYCNCCMWYPLNHCLKNNQSRCKRNCSFHYHLMNLWREKNLNPESLSPLSIDFLAFAVDSTRRYILLASSTMCSTSEMWLASVGPASSSSTTSWGSTSTSWSTIISSILVVSSSRSAKPALSYSAAVSKWISSSPSSCTDIYEI